MRVGLLSYPMLFQRDGGLQVQVRETLLALNRLERVPGIPLMQAELVDPCRTRLDDYDLIHVFAAINGNHRIVEAAREMGVPVVLSPLVPPGWNRFSGARARLAERALGRLTGWELHTSYAQIRSALQLANVLIALGEAEQQAICAAFRIEAGKVRRVANGISPHFFNASAALFRSRTSIEGPFALMVGRISPYKNQLGMARVLAEMALPFVVIGEAEASDGDYLRTLRAMPGVTWLGSLRHEDRMLASAFAAAAVYVLPSQGEVAPLTVLEALAAGTPALMTADSALSLPGSEFALAKVRWDDTSAQKRALLALLDTPPDRARVRALVQGNTWDSVARQIAQQYQEVLHGARGLGAARAVASV
ncbi:MAG: glycosyltransferase family 4 protein [Massilia sp.]